jgi:hypothetical protein
LINHNATAKRISDAIISGRVNMHGNLWTTWNNCFDSAQWHWLYNTFSIHSSALVYVCL